MPIKQKKKAIIILPTYNERENIKTLIPEIFLITSSIKNWGVEILVVDDSSPDKTYEEVKNLQKKYKNLHLLILEKKQGLGKAYCSAFRYAYDNLSPDYLFEMDADWQHEPKLIPCFLDKIDEGAEFVIGSRYISGGSIPKNWKLYRKFFSYCGNLVFRLGFMKLHIHDWTSGYRAINAKFIYKTMPAYENLVGYTFQAGILNQAINNKLPIAEIPLKFKDRPIGGSKMNVIEFVINNLLFIFFNSSFVKFSIVGFIGAFVDFGGSFILIELFKKSIWLSTAISVEISIVVNFLLNNFWSFSYKKIRGGLNTFTKAFINFNTVSVGNILIQTTFMYFAVLVFPPEYWYIYKVLIIGLFIVPYSYFMYNRFVWNDSKKIQTRD